MKILAVDQNAVTIKGRGIYHTLRQIEDIDLTLLVPTKWEGDFGTVHFEIEKSGLLHVISGATVFTGRSHRAVYPTLFRTLAAIKPDILFINAEPESYLAWQAVFLGPRISPMTKIVFISWRNINYPDGEFPYKLAFLNAYVERVVLSRADHCIAHNESAKQILSDKGFRNITVIHPPVDTTIFKQQREQLLFEKLGLKSFVIGYIGRFIHEKGIDLLLQAAKMLEFDYQILLVGDGPAKSHLMELARELGISGRVVWGGPVPHAEIPAYLNALDVLVLPSRTGRTWKEQFGRILIEAMACGVPVIGTSSGEIPRVIADAGLVFKENDLHALALGLQKLHSDLQLRSDLSARGLDRVQKYFSVSRVASQYYQVFNSLASTA